MIPISHMVVWWEVVKRKAKYRDIINVGDVRRASYIYIKQKYWESKENIYEDSKLKFITLLFRRQMYNIHIHQLVA